MIKLDNVSVKKGSFTLGPLNLDIKRDERIILMGSNGSGKTTFLDLISSLIAPDEGEVKTKLKVSYAPSMSEDMFFLSTVLDEFLFNRGRKSKEDVKKEAEALLSLLSLDKKVLDKSPFSLSGGEQRLLSIALTLSADADFFLFDESITGLDYKGWKAFRRSLEYLKSEKKGYIVSSHERSLLDLTDRFIILSSGRVLFDGKAEDAMKEGLVEPTFAYRKSLELYGEPILSLDELIRRKNG